MTTIWRTSYEEELAESQYALNRTLSRMGIDHPEYENILSARDQIWCARRRLNPELRG